MKKLIKILSVIILLLILSTHVYISQAASIDNLGLSKINLEGNTKYIGMILAVVIIVLVIFLGYRSDKKSENIQNDDYEDVENDYPYEEASVSEGNSFLDEENVSTTDLVEEAEYEEESLFNTANSYIENTESSSMLDEEDEILTEEKKQEDELLFNDSNETNILDEDKFSFEEKEEENIVNTEEISFETNPDNVSTELDEGFSFDTNVEEDSNIEESIITPMVSFNVEENSDFDNTTIQEENNNTDKKRFTRKKQVSKEETEDLETKFDNIQEEIETFDLEDDFEEDDEDDDTPTFDELLKKSEEETGEETETFDFMAEMEENLKKDQAKRLQKKTTKKSVNKTNKSTAKKTATPKTSTKKKKNNEE